MASGLRSPTACCCCRPSRQQRRLVPEGTSPGLTRQGTGDSVFSAATVDSGRRSPASPNSVPDGKQYAAANEDHSDQTGPASLEQSVSQPKASLRLSSSSALDPPGQTQLSSPEDTQHASHLAGLSTSSTTGIPTESSQDVPAGESDRVRAQCTISDALTTTMPSATNGLLQRRHEAKVSGMSSDSRSRASSMGSLSTTPTARRKRALEFSALTAELHYLSVIAQLSHHDQFFDASWKRLAFDCITNIITVFLEMGATFFGVTRPSLIPTITIALMFLSFDLFWTLPDK